MSKKEIGQFVGIVILAVELGLFITAILCVVQLLWEAIAELDAPQESTAIPVFIVKHEHEKAVESKSGGDSA